MSYVRLYKPWNWVVGTGMYLKDVRAEVAAITKNLVWAGLGVFLMIAVVTAYLAASSLAAESARQKVFNDLKYSEEKFRCITAGALDGIVMIDSKGRVTFWNQAAEKIFGYSADEVLGSSLHRMVAGPGSPASEISDFSQRGEQGRMRAVGKVLEINAFRKDGSMAPVELSISELSFMGKWHAIGVVRDITKRKQTDRALRAVAESVAEPNEDIFQFLVRQLALSLGKRYAVISRVDESDPGKAHMVAAWADGAHGEIFSYELEGTPSKEAVEKGLVLYPCDLKKHFPNHWLVTQKGAESYLGTPLRDSAGRVIGVMVVLDDPTNGGKSPHHPITAKFRRPGFRGNGTAQVRKKIPDAF